MPRARGPFLLADRNPRYTGFLLITLGMICEWATITLLVTSNGGVITERGWRR